MHDKHIRLYLQKAQSRLESREFKRVVSTLSQMEEAFGLRTFRYEELPMGFDNQLFKEQVIHRSCFKSKKKAHRWAKHIFGVRTYQNTSIVVVCPPIVNPLTKDADTREERLCLLSQTIQRDIAAYNTVKPSFKPRLAFRITDLILYSPDAVSVMIFQEGMFDQNEHAQAHFMYIP